MPEQVTVEGLAKLRRALKQVDADLPKELRTSMKLIGDKLASAIRAKVPQRSGKAAASVRSGVSGNTAYIAAGKKAVPYFGWLDFGGTLKPTGGRRGTQSRPVLKEGRYIYPTLAEHREETTLAAVAAMDATARKAGLL